MADRQGKLESHAAIQGSISNASGLSRIGDLAAPADITLGANVADFDEDEELLRSSVDTHEYRAYLQRGETRLSTLHRVAGAFISGAGLLTLLPILISGAFSGLLVLILFYPSERLPLPGTIGRWLALAPVLASLALPLAALYLLIRDLTLFYFTARTFKRDRAGTVYPRFILSGIMVSQGHLQDTAHLLERARSDEYVRDLLVPSPAAYRRRILKEAQSIGVLTTFSMNDNEGQLVEELREYVLNQTASHKRSLPEEAAKMEASIARHNRFLRSLVLRYAKAFLLTIVTTVITLAASGVLNLLRPVDSHILAVNPQFIWLITLLIYAIWALVAAVVVRKPVEWLYADTGNVQFPRTPQPLLNFERATLIVSILTILVITGAAISYRLAIPITSGQSWLLISSIALVGIATLVVSAVGLLSEWRSS